MHRFPVRAALASLLIFLGVAVARIQAQSPTELIAIVSVEGLEDAASYAAVTTWLESTVSPQALSVEGVSGATVVYRIRTQGDLQQLADTLGTHPRLQALSAPNSASLSFRYSL